MTAERPDPEFEVVVTAREVVAKDVVALTLARPGQTPLPGWEPGSHIDLVLPGRAEHAPIRQYSLCGDPDDRGAWQVAVLREAEGSGTSAYVHDQLSVGDHLCVRGPRNHFPLATESAYLFLAGGIGITPLLPMVESVAKAGADWQLLYLGRSRDAMAFAERVEALGPRARVHARDDAGRLELADVLADTAAGTVVYCCGPERLIEGVEQAWADRPDAALHVERFTARPLGEPVRTDAFEVVLQDSGQTLIVPPGESILDVVERAGVTVYTSCGEGTCGTCETGVLEGTPDHRDSVLTAAERESNDCMMICVSRALSERLVLEL